MRSIRPGPSAFQTGENKAWAAYKRTCSQRLVAAVLALFAQPLDRDDALALAGREHDHAFRGPAGDANSIDRHSDKLPAVAHQHDLVGHIDRERRDQRADLLQFADVGRANAFAA